MTTSYPTALDTFSNPSATTQMDAAGYEHDTQHANANDAIEAIEAALGVDGTGHSAERHTNLTRYFPRGGLRASNMTQDGTATVTTYGTLPAAEGARDLADAATNGVYSSLIVPEDCLASSDLDISLYYVAATTRAGSESVRWSVNILALPDQAVPGDITGAGTTTDFTDGASAHTANNVYKAGRSGVATVSAGNLIRVNVRRVGGHGDDTYAATVGLWMLRFAYTATQ